ncbi:peptide-methionine (S)-S-oxide reductase MsrA [Corynebacterium gerontici]|uniref:Peptide methionine sulfoxide reductase MsrA n=1 Tax=Corynebacterium gerontici TaxID=2079234 RepID=A0A3G6J2Z6_9CORY|nr:peptide-methionine (S)-S-oxide reductase MsrA [Corynebacterium gerontici]AZA10484.1 Peptide methionine sulfoxide reductase MsrA [Corynebacterium gerontici]
MGWLFAREPELVDADRALKGGRHPVLEHPRPHAVLGTSLTGPWDDELRELYVGLGCFWGAEKLFWQTEGVKVTSVGYAGGITENPTYREVCSGRTNHTEIVHIVYDPKQVSFEQLVAVALEAHDPTQGYRQGNDVGTQYRSAIYTQTSEEAEVAQRMVDAYGAKLAVHGFSTITTEVKPLADTPAGRYFLAEDEHQQYLHKNPGGYCPHHSTGVACGVE